MEEGRGPYWDDLPEADGGPELLAGRWAVTRVEYGKLAFVPGCPRAGLAGVRDVTFADGRCTMTGQMTIEQEDPGRPPDRVDLAVTFDPAASPKGLDLSGPGPRPAWRCIYKLTCDGQLLLAFGDPEDGRPAGFDPTRNPGMLLVCDRAGP